MTDGATFVLDTNVISSFYAVDWLESLEFWRPERKLLAPDRVWSEFEDYADATRPPWLKTRAVDLQAPRVDAPGALAPADWACVVLAESSEGRLVTNDRAMHAVAAERGVQFMWGTQLLLKTFHGCGITERELRTRLDEYARDLGLGEGVTAEVRSAEK